MTKNNPGKVLKTIALILLCISLALILFTLLSVFVSDGITAAFTVLFATTTVLPAEIKFFVFSLVFLAFAEAMTVLYDIRAFMRWNYNLTVKSAKMANKENKTDDSEQAKTTEE